ncbi:hypothetical protein BH09SUM1_BH09SUM1_19900 [soil metagenome]
MRVLILSLSTLLISVNLPAVDFGPRPAKPSNLTVYLTGDSADAPNQAVGGPAVLVMGGGTEVDAGFSQQAYPIVNGGDILVLRTSGSNGYNDYFYNLVTGPLKPNSVETILPTTVSKANTDYVEWACDTAEMIWFAGGDQSDYTSNWRGTKLQAAVQRAYDRGAVIGGTSAGMDLVSHFIFDPGNGSIPTGATAITNPYITGNTITDYFIDSPLMANTINDAHFFQRDRMGRPLSWMAQLRQDGRTDRIIAIAGDEKSSMFIGNDRIGHVLTGASDRAMYVMWEDGDTTRTQAVAGKALIYSNVLRTRLTAGGIFDFNTMTGSRNPIRLSVNGGAAPPYTPTDPYTPDEGPPYPPVGDLAQAFVAY